MQAHERGRAGEALGPDFLPQDASVVTALRPALAQVALVGGEERGPRWARRALEEAPGAHVARDGPPAEVDLAPDGAQAHALCIKLGDLVVAAPAPIPAIPHLLRLRRQSRFRLLGVRRDLGWCGLDRGPLVIDRRGGSAQGRMLAREDPFEGLPALATRW